MQTTARTRQLASWITLFGMPNRKSTWRRTGFAVAGLVAALLTAGTARADDFGQGGGKWAASWATSIQAAYVLPTTQQGSAVPAYDPQPDLSIALPNATTSGAVNQTFR
ncbi:MAG TPA: hypothetical protein VFE79_02205, partial [Paraburkholderia sp.]|nr:hypothetical protein [Paraburkholderia sp.]